MNDQPNMNGQAQLLVNGARKFRVAESCQTGGITMMEAGRKYSGSMPTLGLAAPFFLSDQLWAENEPVLQRIRPIITNTHIAAIRAELSQYLVNPSNVGDFLKKDSIFKAPTDNIIRIVEESKGQFILELFNNGAWLFPLPPEFLDANSIRLSDKNTLFLAENSITVANEGFGCYVTTIDNIMQNLRAGKILTKFSAKTGEFPFFFGEGGESLSFYTWFNSKEVKVSFACLGSDYYDYDERLNVVFTSRPDVLFGALVEEKG